jgi:Uma2 family endonuclease
VQPAPKLATYEDLLALPEGTKAEILDGVLVIESEVVDGIFVSPPGPLPRHGRAQRAMGRFVGGPFDDDDGRGGPGGWWILPEVDVQFGARYVVRPDLAGWRRERLPSPWDTRPIDVTPDWICEVISPSNPANDRVKKRRLYAAHGVALYWLIDPEARVLEALRCEGAGSAWTEVGSYDDESVARIAPFDAIELEVGRLFPPR